MFCTFTATLESLLASSSTYFAKSNLGAEPEALTVVSTEWLEVCLLSVPRCFLIKSFGQPWVGVVRVLGLASRKNTTFACAMSTDTVAFISASSERSFSDNLLKDKMSALVNQPLMQLFSSSSAS